MIWFVCIILLLLLVISLIRGYRFPELIRMAVPGVRGALIVIEVLILIGCLTGLWRISGTIPYFITAGVRLLPPSLFVLSAFLLSAVMSLSIGTSFGVAATAGVILMSIARAGNIQLLPVAGAILSGIYVGDRNSPAASSATLVASVTGTELSRNLRMMFRSAAVPVVLCILFYGILSFRFPMQSVSSDVILLLEKHYRSNLLCLFPALLMIVLPMCRISVKTAMAIDIGVSFLLTVFLQKQTVQSAFSAMLFGYRAPEPALSGLLNGGGIRSMLSVCVILLVSGSFADIMKGTGLLEKICLFTERMRERIGRFPTMALLSVLVSMVFCNQTISVMMVNRLTDGLYDAEKERYSKMLDMEDSVIVIAGLIPWCIACSVPLQTMDVGIGALRYAFFLWLVPVWHFFAQRKTETVTEKSPGKRG